jgi:hypothetical protein
MAPMGFRVRPQFASAAAVLPSPRDPNVTFFPLLLEGEGAERSEAGEGRLSTLGPHDYSFSSRLGFSLLIRQTVGKGVIGS